MKKTLKQTKFASYLAVFIAALMFCAGYASKAALIVYEGMDYPAGATLNGQTNGTGWTVTNLLGWQVNSTAPSNAMIRLGSLSYTDPLGNQLLTSSNRVHITGDGSVTGENVGGTTATAQPFRLIDHNLWPGAVAPGSNVVVLTNSAVIQTTWLSFLMQRTGAAVLTNAAHAGIYYNRAVGMQFFANTTEVLTAGRGSQNSETNTTWASDTYAMFMRGNAQFSAISSNHLTNASMIVIRVDHRGQFSDALLSNISAGVFTNSDSAYMWINHTNLTVEPVTNNALTLNSTDYGAGKDFILSRFRLFAGSLSGGFYGSADIDEIRAGTNYFDVTPLNCSGASFATNPASITKPENTSATFSVYANGTAPTYQWQASYDGGSTYTNVPSATSSNYTKSSLVLADDQSKYRCIASVACNSSSATSSVATLTVIACVTASVTTSPSDITVGGGATANFTVVAGGSQPTYQWQVSADNGATFTNVTTGTGATTASYTTAATTFGANQSNQFRAIINVACDSSSATSAPALLTLTCNTVGISSPSSTTVLATSNATFTAVATGTAPTNQWQVSTDGGTTWNHIVGQTSASYIRTTVTGDNGYQFRALAGVSCDASSITSAVATLTVADPAGSSFRSAATGNWNANTTWELSTDNGSTWVAAPGTPSFANSTNIAVRSGHTVSATAAVTVDDLNVNSGGILEASGALITITNVGAPTDVYGSLRIANVGNSALSTNANTSYLRFQNGGKFVWNIQATAIVPRATWNDGSTCVFSNSTTGTFDMTGFSGQNFYDVLFVGVAASARPRFAITNDTVIRHDLTCILPDFAASTMGWLSGTNVTLTVSNDVTVITGTTANSTKVLPNTSATTISTVRVGGNVNINGNIDGFGSSSLQWIFDKASGSQSYSALNVTNILTPGVMTYRADNGTTLTLLQDVTNCAAFNVTNNSTLVTGTKVITGTAFTLNSGSTLNIGSTGGIAASGATGNIQTTTRTFNTAANYVYSGSSSQVLGSGLPSTVNNLTLATGMTNSVTVSNTVANATPKYTVSGTLTANSAITAYTVSGPALKHGTFNMFTYGALSGTLVTPPSLVSGSVLATPSIVGGDLIVPNNVPVTNNVTVSRASGLTAKIKKSLVATDADSDTLTFTFGASTNGVTFTQDATHIYVPANSVNDELAVSIDDGFGGTGSAIITLNIVAGTGQGSGTIDTTGANANLTFYGLAGTNYSIQVSVDAMATWTDLVTNTAPASGVMTYTDTMTTNAATFYRLRYVP